MHRSRATLASLLSGLLLASTVASFVAPTALAVSPSDFQRHQKKAADARRRAADAEKTADRLASEVLELDQEIERIQAEADALDPKISKAAARTARIQRDVDALTVEVDRTQGELEATQAEYTKQQALLSDRVAASYRQGSWFYLDVLLGSADIGDLIARTEFVSRVIESNNELAGELETIEASLTRTKVKLDRSLAAVSLKKREAADVEAELRGLQRAREQRAAEREAVQTQKADLMADNKRNARRLRALAEAEEAESARIAAELAAAGNGSGLFAGTMVWPVPASQRITSRFGPRICPFHGREIHPGIDIGAPQGSSILAAASGTVIYAGYRGGYGNTIILDHGNGVTTLYAHQAPGGLRVGNGAQVSAGQRIGTVGSTGSSTGPHLHFEVRVNGAPKNPMGYF